MPPILLISVLSSTSMTAKLERSPSLPAKDKWKFASRLSLRCYKSEGMVLSKTLAMNRMPSNTAIISGLEKYTRYSFGVDYFGHLNSSVDYYLAADISSPFRTAEDGKNIEITSEELDRIYSLS